MQQQLDNRQNRSGLIKQAWVGLAGILLLIVVPSICKNRQVLITFLSLLLVPPLIVFLLRRLEGRFDPAKLACSIYFLTSACWLALGVMGLTLGPPWSDSLWLPQGVIGLAIGVALMYKRGWAYPGGAFFAVLGLRAIVTSGALPLISAVLSAAAMLCAAYAASLPEIGFGWPKRAAHVVLGIAILLMIPFPFHKPTALKIAERYKMRSMERYSGRVKSGEKDNLKPLMQALNDPDGLIRSEAVRHLGSIAQEKVEQAASLSEAESHHLDTIIDTLGSRIDDAEARPAVISQLAAIRDYRTVRKPDGELGPLIDALRQHPDMDGYPDRAIFEAFGESAAQLMIELLEDSAGSQWKNIRTRRRIIIALGNFREPRVAAAIAKYLGDESRDVRQAAANSMRRMRRADTVEILTASLKDDNRHVRRAAAELLGEIRNRKSLGALVEALEDEDASVRKYAAEALGNIGDERALNPLVAALEDEDRIVRRRIVRALGNMGRESAVDPLIAALEDEYIRREAAEALRKIGQPKGIDAAVEAMVQDLRHDEPHVSASAAEVLGRIGSERAVTPLIKALRDRRPRVREMAALALGNIGGETAVQALINALEDHEPSARRAAAEALHRIGDPQGITLAVEAMLRDLDDRNPDVRASAAEILGRIGSRGVVPHLKRIAQADGNHRVRDSATSALARLTNIQLKDWLMIGPFDNTDGTGFDREYSPEHKIDLSAVYDGKEEKVRWLNYSKGDTINLLPLFTPNQHVVVYALTYIASPNDREAVFRIGSDDGIKVWLNDSLVWSNDIYRGMKTDSDIFDAQLKRGKNKLLMKLTQGDREWGFHFRITDSDGLPFHDLEYSLEVP